MRSIKFYHNLHFYSFNVQDKLQKLEISSKETHPDDEKDSPDEDYSAESDWSEDYLDYEDGDCLLAPFFRFPEFVNLECFVQIAAFKPAVERQARTPTIRWQP